MRRLMRPDRRRRAAARITRPRSSMSAPRATLHPAMIAAIANVHNNQLVTKW
jgi:hypothetical protein